MALTRKNIIEEISDRLSLSPADAKHSIEALLEVMKATLASGEDVMISGFGKFQVNDKTPRKGRNPATGEDMTLNGRRVLSFKCSGKHREKINGITHE